MPALFGRIGVNFLFLIFPVLPSKIYIKKFFAKITSLWPSPSISYIWKGKSLVVIWFSNLFEGSPNVLVEAMKLKKYIISTDCPTGPREILKNGKYGSLVPVGSYKQIANIIINFKLNSKIKTKINEGYESLKKYDHNLNCKIYKNL